jgi:hypothetical protein
MPVAEFISVRRWTCLLVSLCVVCGLALPMRAGNQPGLTAVIELKAHMRWVVGNGNQGKIQEMEERLNRHETHLQRLVGVGSALAAAITVMNLVANFLKLHH